MNLLPEVYQDIGLIRWLTTVGDALRPNFEFFVTFADSRDAALKEFNSDVWADAKTQAQGDLTGYLAKYHYDSYGASWNNLAKHSRAMVESMVESKLSDALKRRGFPAEMINGILLDLNRAALETAYRRSFPKAPLFFERLLSVYKTGRIPCGWNGDMNDWPAGNIIVF